MYKKHCNYLQAYLQDIQTQNINKVIKNANLPKLFLTALFLSFGVKINKVTQF